MFVGIGYNGNLKTAGSGITNGKTHAIDRDRPFLDSRISLTHHIGSRVIYKRVIPTAIGLFHLRTPGCTIDMSLNDMPVETTVHKHTTFEIHFIAGFQQSQITAIERLLYRRYRIGISIDADNSQTHPVMCNTLIDFQFTGETARKSQMQIALFAAQCHRSGFLYDS